MTTTIRLGSLSQFDAAPDHGLHPLNDNGTADHSGKNISQNNCCDSQNGKYGIFGNSSDGVSNVYNNNTVINYSVADIDVAATTALPSAGLSVSELNASPLACNAGKAGL
jgi:hypothetical protein